MKLIRIAGLVLATICLGQTDHLLAQDPTTSNGFDEFLNFNDNLVPPGWTITFHGGNSQNAEITNQRFQIDQVDSYAALEKDKTLPAGSTQVAISFRTVVNDVYWGAGSQARLIMQDGTNFLVNLQKAGFGNEQMEVSAGQDGALAFDQFYPPDYGEYLLSAAFRNGHISFTVLKKGSITPLVSQTVSVRGLNISQLQTVWLFGVVTTGPSQWIDDASITATSSSPANVVYGIDTSHYQSSARSPIEWNSVWGSNHLFAFVKSSEGMNLEDPQFHPNIDNALAAGVIAAPYHLGRPDQDLGTAGAQAEADYFLLVANDYLQNGRLRPVLDIETDHTCPHGQMCDPAQLAVWIDAWMTEVRARILANTGEDVPPILYMSRGVISQMPTSLTQYPLWVSNPNGSETRVGNIMPWTTWSFHQYLWGQNGGICPGVNSPNGCDLDAFNGTLSDLNALILGANP